MMKIILIVFLLACPPVFASVWEGIDEGVGSGWQEVECEDGSGWRLCEIEKDRLYLRAGTIVSYITKGPSTLTIPPNGTISTCQNVKFTVVNGEVVMNPGNCQWFGTGANIHDTLVNQYIARTVESTGRDGLAHITYCAMTNDHNSIQSTLCDDRLRTSTHVGHFSGARSRYVELIPGTDYVYSDINPGVRYKVGKAILQLNQPAEYVPDYSIWHEVTKEYY